MAEQRPRACRSLTDLDDACLHIIIRHLVWPEAFHLASSCWRLHRLASDKRLWLVVAPASIPPEATPSGRLSGPIYSTLREAVADSRPGDTIWLSPGTHSCDNISITHPVHLLGGGTRPEDTLLVAAAGADHALSFSASAAKVAMLAVSATLCACLIHRRGQLTVERCRLAVHPRGLQHLLSPLHTLAVSFGSGGASSSAALRRQQQLGMLPPAPAAYTSRMPLPPTRGCIEPPSSATAGGSGRLLVVECCLEGGSTAVRCCGTGRPANVRVIYESRTSLLWLEVDSAADSCWSEEAAAACPAADDADAAEGVQQQQQQQQQQPQPQLLAEQALEEKQKMWQCRGRLAAVGEAATGAAGSQQQGGLLAAPGLAAASGLARIQQQLKSLHPAALAHHLAARQQKQQQR